MVRVTNYFDTQLRVPIGEGTGVHVHSRHLPTAGQDRGINSSEPVFQGTSITSRTMTDEQIIGWYGKILDSVRLRYRKLQRFAR
jgi:mitogen-activated protein kinase kinase kinase